MAIESDEVRSAAEELLDAGAHDPLDTMRHSTAHVMAAAVLDLFPEAKLGIGPAIRDGFYYDFDLPRALTPADLEAIEERMRSQVTANLPFERSELGRDEAVAREAAAGQTYKAEIIGELPPGEVISFFQHGTFIDLCRGPHLGSTGKIGPFKLLNSAAAYWRGDEKRPMLQRIYGSVWETQEDLDRYLWRVEEAKKRDHRKLGRELDLFSFHPESPAAPFWHPRGMALWRALEDWSRQVRREGGFVEVRTPGLVRKELWETSGHWALYQENMFVFEDGDHVAGLKPMNCPESMLIFKTALRSYRDLPMRLADYSWLFRNERTGALAGMFRVRQLTQDDSHVICREDQVIDEVKLALRLVRRQYEPFGFEPRFKLATRPEKKLGTDDEWDFTEGALRNALDRREIDYLVHEEDGAFYGPKIDLHMTDVLGRSWQMGTIQLDSQMPARFELTCMGADNREHTPYVIHRALLGSLERFIGILIEHYGGEFPFWLAPVQLRVLPVGADHREAARGLAARLREAGYRVEVDERDDTVGKRIREGELEKIPYVIVYGDRESDEFLAIRERHGVQSTKSLDELLAELSDL